MSDTTRVRLAVAAGGAVGSLGRVGLAALLAPFALPWSTLLVNVTGAAALAALAGRLRHPVGRAAVLTGVIGAWTTVSTLAVDAVALGADAGPATALGYVVATIVAGLTAVVVVERRDRRVDGRASGGSTAGGTGSDGAEPERRPPGGAPS